MALLAASSVSPFRKPDTTPISVLHIITGLENGGAEAVLYRLCAADRGRSHAVISLTGPGKYGPLLRARGINVHCLKMPQGRVTVRGLWRLWRLLRRERPAIVQTWMYHADLVGGVIARLAGQRNTVWGLHNTTLEPGKSSRTTIFVMRLCARLSGFIPRRIICCAEKCRDVHAEQGYDQSRMRVIPNGYDMSVSQPDPAARLLLRAELGLEKNVPVLGFVARFDPQKDHANLLRALAHIKAQGIAAVCLLVGSGMDKDNLALAAMIAEHGLSDLIRLLGQRSDIPAVMNALDLHVMSSAFGEAFPNVLCEAMACGTPCVSTDVGDAALIVGNTGWIVPPRSPAELARAIDIALGTLGSAEWSERQRLARAHIEANFTITRMVAAYHAVWDT